MTRLPREQIKGAAQNDIMRVLRALGIHDDPRGHSIVLCNPVRQEKTASLQIWIKPGYEGAWKDHGAGLQGDVFDLVAYFNGWQFESDKGFAKACDWLAKTLGLAEGAPSENERTTQMVCESAARRAAEAAERDELARRAAQAIWLKGAEDITPLAPYFRRRGIDLKRLARKPGALRLIGRHEHRESRQHLPCMAAMVSDGTHFRAVHRTWLTLDCSAKASTIGINPARKIWPGFTGGYIPLARGHSGLPLKAAIENGIADDLVLTEGIEKALAIAVADSRPRVWAFGALANLAHVPVPACATSVIVAADNDIGNDRAQALLQRGLDHLATFGVPVEVMRTPIGKDVDEFLQAGEQDHDET